MIFYLIVILIAVSFFRVAAKYYKVNNLVFYCMFIAYLLVLAVIEGYRDISVGRDLASGYGSVWYGYMRFMDSPGEVFRYFEGRSQEYGYIFLLYFSSILSSKIYLSLFLSSLIKYFFLGITALSFRKKLNATALVFVYLIFFYVVGFNLMRQTLALSIALFSLTFFFKKKYYHFLIVVLLAYFFHNSAIFMLLLLPLNTLRTNKFILPTLVVVLIVLIDYGAQVLYLAAASGLFKSSIADMYVDSGVTTAKADILLVSFMLANTFIKSKNFNFSKIPNSLPLLKFVLLLSLFLLLMSTYIEVAFRVSYFFVIVSFILFPVYLRNLKKQMKTIMSFGYYLLLIMYFILNSLHGFADAIPYSSKILNL